VAGARLVGILGQVEALVVQVAFDGTRLFNGRRGGSHDGGHEAVEAAGVGLFRVRMELHGRSPRELGVRGDDGRVGAHRDRLRLRGNTRRQGGVRPHVKAQALLLRARVLPAERHLTNVTGHGNPRAEDARGLDCRSELPVAQTGRGARDRGAHRHVAVTHVDGLCLPVLRRRGQHRNLALRRTHREGRPVVHVQRRQTDTRARGQATDRHDGLLAQVLLVVAERRQRRRVLAHVKRRLHQLARHDASPARSPRVRHRQRHAHREDDHQRRGQQAPRTEHGLTGCAARRHGRRTSLAMASSIDGHVQAQGEALMRRGPRQPQERTRTPHHERPHGRHEARGTESQADDAHERNREDTQERAPPAHRDEAGAERAQKAGYPGNQSGSHIGGGGRRQRQQVFPGADRAAHERQQRVRRRHDTPAHRRRQGDRPTHEEIAEEDGRQRGERVPRPAGRGSGNQQAHDNARAGRSEADPGPEHGLVREDRPGKKHSEHQERRQRQRGPGPTQIIRSHRISPTRCARSRSDGQS